MAKKLRVFVMFDKFAAPVHYHIRRAGDKAKTLCNKEVLPGETCVTKRPKKLPVCGMCKSLLSFSSGSKISVKKKKLAKEKRIKK